MQTINFVGCFIASLLLYKISLLCRICCLSSNFLLLIYLLVHMPTSCTEYILFIELSCRLLRSLKSRRLDPRWHGTSPVVCVCVCVFPVGGRVNVSQGIISIPPNASHHVGIPFKWNFCSFYIKPMDVSLAAFPVMSFLNVHVLRAHSPPSLDRIAPLGGSSLRLAARL